MYFCLLDNTPLVIKTDYSSQLSTDNQKYGRTGCQSLHYYEALEINVITDGIYTITSFGYEILHGYLYRDYFNPLNPSENLLLQDYKSCSNSYFKLISYLRCNTSYILIVTTYLPSKTTIFSIYAYGPNEITFNRTSKHIISLRSYHFKMFV